MRSEEDVKYFLNKIWQQAAGSGSGEKTLPTEKK